MKIKTQQKQQIRAYYIGRYNISIKFMMFVQKST